MFFLYYNKIYNAYRVQVDEINISKLVIKFNHMKIVGINIPLCILLFTLQILPKFISEFKFLQKKTKTLLPCIIKKYTNTLKDIFKLHILVIKQKNSHNQFHKSLQTHLFTL